MVAARIANMAVGRPTDNRANLHDLLGNNSPIEPISQCSAAELLSVGRESVKRAAVVQREAVPELVYAAFQTPFTYRPEMAPPDASACAIWGK